MPTLLELAKAAGSGARGRRTDRDPEQVLELALAWFNGEIMSGRQITAAMGGTGGGNAGAFAFSLKRAIQNGKVRIEVIK